MKRYIPIIFIALIAMIFTYNKAFSQIEEQFVNRYTSNAKNVDKGRIVRVDPSGKAFVGGTANGHFVIIKYASNGNQLKLYTGNQMDTLVAMAFDNNNDIIAAGVVSSGGSVNICVMKIRNSGDSIVYSKTFDGGANEFVSGLAIDTSNNFYTSGYRVTGTNGVDFYTVKYLGATGDTLYVKKYNNTGNLTNLQDFGRGIVYDAHDNSITVTGETNEPQQNYNYKTIKYNALTGDSVWAKSYNNSGLEDIPVAIALDPSGNVIVTGSSIGNINDYLTVKYSSATGTQMWSARYTGVRTDYARALFVDSVGNVFVTGASFVDQQHHVVTIKYNSSGTIVWKNTYTGTGNDIDEPFAIAMDKYKNIFVAGSTTGIVGGASSGKDGLILMIDTLGNTKDAHSYYGETSGADTVPPYPGAFLGVDIDKSTGAVWVTGFDSTAGSSSDLVTIKFESRNSVRGYVMRDLDGNAATGDSADRKPLSGAKIVLVDQFESRLDSVYSLGDGSYTLPLVFDGQYTIYQYPPDETWQAIKAIPGTGGISQTTVDSYTDRLLVSVSGSQISKNNGFIDYNPYDSLKYRTLTLLDYGTKKDNKITKVVKKVPRIIGLPNMGNVRDTIFARSFPKKTLKKFIIGVVDSPVTRWWIKLAKGTDIQKVYPMTGKPQFFVLYAGKDKVGSAKISEKTSLTGAKYNNGLAAEQVVLKMNLLGCEDSILTPGLGNLIYDDGKADNPLNGHTVSEITSLVDSLLTFRGRPLASLDNAFISALTCDSTLARINRAFRTASIDSLRDTLYMHDHGALRLVAKVPISNSGFLRYNPNPPARVAIDFPSIEVPSTFALYQNYPNPFNPTTNISFELPAKSVVTLKVYNILGQVVATLINNEAMELGLHEYQFDASRFASGVYFSRITVTSQTNGSFESVKKMMLLK